MKKTKFEIYKELIKEVIVQDKIKKFHDGRNSFRSYFTMKTNNGVVFLMNEEVFISSSPDTRSVKFFKDEAKELFDMVCEMKPKPELNLKSLETKLRELLNS